MSLVVRPHDSRSRFDESPNAYVWHLAKYIRDPSKIRAYTINNFGRAPSLERIKATIEVAQAPNKPKSENNTGQAHMAEDDGQPFRVRALRDEEGDAPAFKPLIVVKVETETSSRDVPIITAADVISAVARDFNLTLSDLTGKSRSRPIMLARRTAAYALAKRGNSTPQVGRWLGVDHSSVAHAIQQFEARATDEMRRVAARYIPEAAKVVAA